MTAIRFPYSRPSLVETDIAAAVEALNSPILTQGPRIEEFQAAFASAVGAVRAVACANGTAALHLIYAACGVGPDAGVIVPAVTFLATANAARMCGAPVHFADVDARTGSITPATLDAALKSAAFPVRLASIVHLAGRPCDMPGLKSVADRYGCLLVEDAAHAPGATYQDEISERFAVGSCAHSVAAAFSLHAIKHVSTGEGGMVTTNDPQIARRMEVMRSHGMIREPSALVSAPPSLAPWYYEMHELGWNYRLTEFQAALGIPQIRRLRSNIDKRQRVAEYYDRLLGDFPAIQLPAGAAAGGTHAWHLYQVAVDFGPSTPDRGTVMQRLYDEGIGSQVHYIPLPSQPYYRAVGEWDVPGARQFYSHTLSIPMYESLEPSDQEEIADALFRAVGQR